MLLTNSPAAHQRVLPGASALIPINNIYLPTVAVTDTVTITVTITVTVTISLSFSITRY